MALVTRSAEIPDVQGKVGGIIHRNDQYGDHIQAFPRLVNREPSTSQRLQRKAFDKCRSVWLSNISSEGSDLWQNYAARHPATTKKGTVTTLTAWQQFLKINLVYARNGLEPILEPPEN